jgi:hypothetical protein
MYARVATFESDPANVDQAIEMVRSSVESEETPDGLEGAKMLMLVSRETGKGFVRRDPVRQRGGHAPRRRGAQCDEPREDGAPNLGRVLRGSGSDGHLTRRARSGGRGPPDPGHRDSRAVEPLVRATNRRRCRSDSRRLRGGWPSPCESVVGSGGIRNGQTCHSHREPARTSSSRTSIRRAWRASLNRGRRGSRTPA